jgi:hypothetical protein
LAAGSAGKEDQMSDPFMFVGYENLGEPLSSTLTCPHCGAEHAMPSRRLAADGVTWEAGPSQFLQFYVCPQAGTFLVGIENRRIK